MWLKIKMDGYRIIDTMGTRLEISFNKYWLKVMEYWIKKNNGGTPILQYNPEYYVLVHFKDYGSSGGYLSFYPLKENKFMYNQLWLKDGKLYFEPSGPPPQNIIHSDLHESFHNTYCDICDVCLDCNEENIIYYDGAYVEKYNKKYDTNAKYICEYCIDSRCISDKDAQN